MTKICPKNAPDYQSCFKRIIERVDAEKQPLTNQELLAICSEKADFLRGEVNPHFAHETAEAALNFLILTKYAKESLAAQNPADVLRDVLRPLVSRLPTQT